MNSGQVKAWNKTRAPLWCYPRKPYSNSIMFKILTMPTTLPGVWELAETGSNFQGPKARSRLRTSLVGERGPTAGGVSGLPLPGPLEVLEDGKRC